MLDLSITQKFTPWPQSRTSEWVSWGIAVVLYAGLQFVPNQLNLARNVVWVLLVFFSVFAVLISFSNLLDRRTLMVLTDDSIFFTNSLRTVEFSWGEIQRVQVIPSRWGEKVFVIGSKARFSFMTEGTVKINNQEKGKIGFQHGQQILDTILHQTGLSSTKKQTEQNYYYYQK